MIDHKKEVIQEEALRAWISAGKRGTLEIITGLGKTFIAFKAIESLPNHTNVLILAETQLRERTIMEDREKYKALYQSDPFKGKNVIFMCYQSAHRHLLSNLFDNELVFVVCDEIHDMLTPIYYRFAENNLLNNEIPVLGLSATIDKKTKYINAETNEEYKKPELLDTFAPICYSYTVNEGQEDGTARKLKLIIVEHQLDAINKSVTAGNKHMTFKQTELASYQYYDAQFRKSLFLPSSNSSREFMIRNAAARKLTI